MRIVFIEIIVFSILAIIMTSCTISFQNISTHGVATDLIDENLKTDADLKSDLSLPAM